MEKVYPLEFTLEDGTHVVVNKAGGDKFDFAMKPESGPVRHFTISNNEEFTESKEAGLDFDQLNAVRVFWLKTRDED